MSDNSCHIYFSLTKDADGYPPYSSEEVDAESLGNGIYRVSGVPVFVYGVGPGDTVRCDLSPSQKPTVVEVLANAGHWVSRVIPFGAAARTPEELERLAVRFRSLGCKCYVSPFGMLAISVAPQAPVAPILSLLESGRNSRKWDFDFGVSPTHQ